MRVMLIVVVMMLPGLALEEGVFFTNAADFLGWGPAEVAEAGQRWDEAISR